MQLVQPSSESVFGYSETLVCCVEFSIFVYVFLYGSPYKIIIDTTVVHILSIRVRSFGFELLFGQAS